MISHDPRSDDCIFALLVLFGLYASTPMQELHVTQAMSHDYTQMAQADVMVHP